MVGMIIYPRMHGILRRRVIVCLNVSAEWVGTVFRKVQILLVQDHSWTVNFGYTASWRKEIQLLGTFHNKDLYEDPR